MSDPQDAASRMESSGTKPTVNGELDGKASSLQKLKPLLRTIVIFLIVLLSVEGTLVAFKGFSTDGQSGHSDLDIIAAVQSVNPWGTASGSNNNISVVGRVLYEGQPATNTQIWCIARDQSGNRFSPTNWFVDKQGQFRMDGMPVDLMNQDSEIRVYARANVGALFGTPLRGETVIATKGLSRQVNIMDSKLWPCTFALFLVSIFIGLAIHVVASEWRRPLYVASVFTALALTTAMLCAIAEAYMKVKASVTPGQTWSVGFISIFEGTYVKDIPEQWLISLTGPPRDGSSAAQFFHNRSTRGESMPDSAQSASTSASLSAAVIQGLGAPMWVVFLAVVGAALSTVALIVNEIRSPPCFFTDDPTALRERMLALVQNQFFMLFAPLGGIFIYQALVLTGAALQPFVVAIAALGAGATLNIVLKIAIAKASDALKTNAQRNEEAEEPQSPTLKPPPVEPERTVTSSSLS